MRYPIKPGLTALAWALSLANSAAATSSGDASAPAPIDWGHAFRTGLIAVGLWFIASLIGRLWIRAKNARAKRPEE
jgi:peptidoglycan/LPS O-acetylase OafA/YrhL